MMVDQPFQLAEPISFSRFLSLIDRADKVLAKAESEAEAEVMVGARPAWDAERSDVEAGAEVIDEMSRCGERRSGQGLR